MIGLGISKNNLVIIFRQGEIPDILRFSSNIFCHIIGHHQQLSVLCFFIQSLGHIIPVGFIAAVKSQVTADITSHLLIIRCLERLLVQTGKGSFIKIISHHHRRISLQTGINRSQKIRQVIGNLHTIGKILFLLNGFSGSRICSRSVCPFQGHISNRRIIRIRQSIFNLTSQRFLHLIQIVVNIIHGITGTESKQYQ